MPAELASPGHGCLRIHSPGKLRRGKIVGALVDVLPSSDLYDRPGACS